MRRRTKGIPKYKLTINIPLEVMEALEKYAFDKGTTISDTLTELAKELLKKEGYLKQDEV